MGRSSRVGRFERLRKLHNGPHPAVTILYGRRYLRDYPDDALAWIWVAIALIELARYEEAEQALAKGLEFCPQERRYFALGQMGHLFREAGDCDQAAEWFARASEAAPDDATYHIYLGAVKAKQGRFAEAEEAHRKAIECSQGALTKRISTWDSCFAPANDFTRRRNVFAR